jgi:hypothetical protein
VGIRTPKIRVVFLRFAFRFRLVFFAFRFLAMRLPPSFISASAEYSYRQKWLVRIELRDSTCDQMATVPLSFMEWVDRKIAPTKDSALHSLA